MATRIKTVQYHFPVLASLPNNTLTNLPQITIEIPESAATSFSVVDSYVEVNFRDIITNTGGTVTTKTFNFKIGNETATSLTNSVSYAHSARNNSFKFYFNVAQYIMSYTNLLANTTLDLALQINQSTGTTLGMVDVCAIFYITYAYDDTDESITYVTNTAIIPLEAFRGVLPTSKPATAQNTVPSLSSYLPETGKSIKQIVLQIQGTADASTSADYILSIQVDTGSTITTQNIERALLTDLHFYYHWVNPATLVSDINNGHNLYYWISTGGVTRFNHLSAKLIVTYTYDFTSSDTLLLSLVINDFYYSETKPNVPTVNETKIKLPEITGVRRCGIYLYSTTLHNSATSLYTKILDASSYRPALIQQGSGNVSGSKVFSDYIENTSIITSGENTLKFFVYSASTDTQLKYYSFFAEWVLNLEISKRVIFNSFKVLLRGLASTNPYSYAVTFNKLTILPTQYEIRHLSILAIVGGSGYFHGFNSYWYIDKGSELIPLFSVNSTADERLSGVRFIFRKFNENEVFKFRPDYWDDNKLDLRSNYNFYVNEQAENIPFAHYILNVCYYSNVKTLSGTTYDNNNGVISSTVYLFKKNFDKIEYITKQDSGTDGKYQFNIYDDESNYFVVARKEGTPNIFDITDFTLQGT